MGDATASGPKCLATASAWKRFQPPASTAPGVEAKRSLEIIIAFYLSHYTGGRVAVPLERPLRDVTVTSW